MEKVGFIGLGKLGLPCAAALSVVGKKKIFGYDVNPKISEYVKSGKVPYQEARIEEFLPKADIQILDSIEKVLIESEIIFIAVQTPHDPMYEGTVPVPTSRKDFDYEYLRGVTSELAKALEKNPDKRVMIVVISTVLPGTMNSIVLPLLSKFEDRIEFCYNPFFIAMGTTIPDYLNPEFILIGSKSPASAEKLARFYSDFLTASAKPMKIESAELAKVAYNTFIGFKIVFANTLGEIVEKRGGDVDEITDALAGATSRLMSKKYFSAGMADGGGCHPRDQIAMSWLAEDADLSADIFGWLANARDSQTERQALLIKKVSQDNSLPVIIMGKSYKADINLVDGSPALLLSSYLTKLNVEHRFYDPHQADNIDFPQKPHVFFVATNHTVFKNTNFPDNSICIDPWGNAIEKQSGVLFICPGRDNLDGK
ncbi:Ugd Predicted UDP-glucose 6-dehydrogenase [Candidatus Nanopelagicaceae bacterium]